MSGDNVLHQGSPVAPGAGSRHWKIQRVTALALVPLSLWFLFSIIDYIGADYQSIVDWVSNPLVAILLVLYLVFMFIHAQLGIEVVMEDYVHNESLRVRCLLLSKSIFIVCGLASVYSIIRLVL